MLRSTVALLSLLAFCSPTFSDTLILSDNLQLKYEDPKLIAHTEDTLILKYQDWSLMHELVNPRTFYPRIDLSGVERTFLRSIFYSNERKKLPEWLRILSAEQAELFGVGTSNVSQKRVGQAEIVGVLNSQESSSHLYIFEELKIHHLQVNGDNKKFKAVIESIEAR